MNSFVGPNPIVKPNVRPHDVGGGKLRKAIAYRAAAIKPAS
jgi:hypothetical protein